MYRLPFELTDSAKLLHFTILGGSADPPAPLNDATAGEEGVWRGGKCPVTAGSGVSPVLAKAPCIYQGHMRQLVPGSGTVDDSPLITAVVEQ